MTEPHIIAEVRSADGWAGMLNAFRLAFDELSTSYRVVNDIAGMAEGHVEKLLQPKPSKNIGPVTFGPLLGALGIKILVVIDEPALASLRRHSRFQSRRHDAPSRHTSKNVRKAQAKRRRSKALPPERARLIRGLATLKMTPQQRTASARHAARMRWKKPRLVELKGKAAEQARASALTKIKTSGIARASKKTEQA